MSDTVIKVENLAKSYRIHHEEREKYQTIREAIGRRWAFLGKKTTPKTEDFWALKDVSFEVKKGQCVGIIGRNGAGKSTLLKILSRITEPTKGRIKIQGRLASLLEVGTGFHPELTGRENIYLNGTILGMSKKEIDRKFDEIVDFAEIERFLDTPVKHYSSGMYMRLAFSVAAHLEPEILVVDEVLAVGDGQFQRKCLGRMEKIGQEGRTVLLVSHNLGLIRSLCNYGIVLNDGHVGFSGAAQEAVDYYQNLGFDSPMQEKWFLSKCKRFSMKMPYWVNEKGLRTEEFNFGEDIYLRFDFQFHAQVPKINPGLAIDSPMGDRLLTLHFRDAINFKTLEGKVNQGHVAYICKISNSNLAPGRYLCGLGVRDESEETAIHMPHVKIPLVINKTSNDFNGNWGYFLIRSEWDIHVD